MLVVGVGRSQTVANTAGQIIKLRKKHNSIFE